MNLAARRTAYICDFAQRSFRDIADQDYIAARLSYRANLAEPFLWSSQQAIEKYLKAILLFNGIGTKTLGHNLNAAISRIKTIQDLDFFLPNDVAVFIKYINDFGTNRYLEYSSFLNHGALMKLDKSVWYVRRYCYYMRAEVDLPNGDKKLLLPFELARVHNEKFLKAPHKLHLIGGFLENTLAKNTEGAESLLWHNFYFGKRRKLIVKKHPSFSSSVNPTLTTHPEAFEILDELVQFSQPFRNFCKSRSRENMPANKD